MCQIKDVLWLQVVFVIRVVFAIRVLLAIQALNLALAGWIPIRLNQKLQTNFGSVTVSLPKIPVVLFEILPH